MNKNIPRHVGYIVDGNRRWAKQRGLSTHKGHMRGYDVLFDVVLASFENGVEYVSAYIFSTENWKRSKQEVGYLMDLIIKILTSDLHKFNDNNIKLKVLGCVKGLSSSIQNAIKVAEESTSKNTRCTLALCINYGGQTEIVDACKNIIESGFSSKDVDIDLISKNLYHPDIPPVDLVVRTSGEYRISNFMLWRLAYSEFLFLDKMFPDMTKEDVADILDDYSKRKRRFGG